MFIQVNNERSYVHRRKSQVLVFNLFKNTVDGFVFLNFFGRMKRIENVTFTFLQVLVESESGLFKKTKRSAITRRKKRTKRDNNRAKKVLIEVGLEGVLQMIQKTKRKNVIRLIKQLKRNQVQMRLERLFLKQQVIRRRKQ